MDDKEIIKYFVSEYKGLKELLKEEKKKSNWNPYKKYRIVFWNGCLVQLLNIANHLCYNYYDDIQKEIDKYNAENE